MLRLAIEVSALALSRAGTGRYVSALLIALGDEEVGVERYELAGEGWLRKVWRDIAWYQRTLQRAARRDGVDLLHCPTMRAPTRLQTPLVVTIHDVAVLRHPKAFNFWTRTYSAMTLPRIARAARRIVVGSKFTAAEVAHLLRVPEEKLRVIPYGVDGTFAAANGRAASGEYVLAVSTLEPRKNLERLVEGFHRADLDGLELRVVGAAGWGGVSVGGVRWLGRVSDEELARQYRGAACTAYVSFYEGFGLPVLEAIRAARPWSRRRAPVQRVRRGRRRARRSTRPRCDRGRPPRGDRAA